MEEKIIRISVRNLVEFILREGDIDNRKAGLPDKEAMQLGGRIHRKIQRQMGSDYHAEVPLKITVPCEGFAIQIEGRADGIQKTADGVVVDEIKGVLRELEYIEKPVGVHLAQAKCYGYIYGKQQELDSITVQMTYCQMETEEVKRFQETFSIEELERWFFDIVMQYEKWARFQIEWRQTRDATIKEAEFPYPYREGQRELVTSVYRTILRKKKLFIQAPTGVGKTMTTIFPAVKAVGEGLGDKIFYLTAKTITRTVAEQAFQILKKNGLQYKVATLTAKEKICFCEKAECNPDVCPYAKGHFDRVNDAVYEMITTMEEMSRENIETQAKKHSVCPFEMGLDVSLWVDAIICDYNYVFDPNAHLKRFFSEGKKGEYLFLIDEAHNLVERGREMYSAVLYKEEFLQMKKAVRYESVKLTRQLEGCNQMLLEMKRECQTYKEYNSITDSNLNHTGIYLYSKGKIMIHLTFDYQSDEGCTTPGQYLRYHRTFQGLTTRELAEKVGVVPATLVLYENDRHPIKHSTAVALANVLGIDRSRLLDEYTVFVDYPYSSLLKKVRRELSFTQMQMAEVIGIGQTTYSGWEREVRVPRRKEHEKILAAMKKLKVDVDTYLCQPNPL